MPVSAGNGSPLSLLRNCSADTCASGCSARRAVWAFDNLNDFYEPQLKRRNLCDIQSLAKPTEFVHGSFSVRCFILSVCRANA
jgi:hypothetical protein